MVEIEFSNRRIRKVNILGHSDPYLFAHTVLCFL